MLKQSLQQKLLQKLSPQQIQLMKLLQVPTLELEARIKQELEANPALEEGGEVEAELDEFDNQDTDEGNEALEEFDFDDYLDDNNSRERSGTTANGTTWKYSERNMRDSEDNDTDYTFTLGELQIVRNDESSRDFAEDKTSVTYEGQRIFHSGDMRCRDGHNQPETCSGLEELEKVFNAVATIEGVTLRKLLSALPISLPADVYRLQVARQAAADDRVCILS